MKKLQLFLIGGSIFFLLIAPIFTNKALAYEGQCHLKHCLVPAPTILGPEPETKVTSPKPGIKGLTWKTTIVKVYLDGVELPNVKQVKHQDYYGSFYVEPSFDLKPGIHYVYTIAHSEKPGWYDQSKESTYIYFTVDFKTAAPIPPQPTLPPTISIPAEPTTLPPITPEPPTINPPAPASQATSSGSNISVTQQGTASSSVGIIQPASGESSVEVQKGKIEGGVYIDQAAKNEPTPAKPESPKTQKDQLGLQEAAGISDLGEILKNEFVSQEMVAQARRNRVIGLSILALIIVLSIIWLVASKQKSKNEMESADGDELPPPPQPPKEKRGRPALRERVIEKSVPVKPPIEPSPDNQATATAEKYFAAPPASPFSPYPNRQEEIKYERIADKDNQSFNPEPALKEAEEQYQMNIDDEQDRLF
jgi:hypothetical protein